MQALAARGVDLLVQVAVLLLAELKAVQVRAPQQAPHHHATACRRAEQIHYLWARRAEQLIGIAAPVGEEKEVAGRPRRGAAVAGIEAGGGVAALRGGQGPVVDAHPGAATWKSAGIRPGRPAADPGLDRGDGVAARHAAIV
jgi:hypothetical protein